MVFKLNKNTKEYSLFRDALSLLVKVVLIFCFVGFIFTFMYGIFRYHNTSMNPSVKDGDLVIYYRLNKKYYVTDVIAFNYKDQVVLGRVIARENDVIDVGKEGLVVNGALQQDKFSKALPYKEGIKFPVTLKEGEVFVLGDNRSNATDSRIFGPVKISDTLGKVITIIRRRGI